MLSMILADGWLQANVLFFGVTTREEGAAPIVH
jgi:hypothetical protein